MLPLLALIATTAHAQPAVLFDPVALTYEERCTTEALQGLVNRDGPRLYLGSAADKWPGIYAERNGLRFETVDSLRALLERFRGVAKGVVVYDPEVDGSRYVALTLAGVEGLLPVAPSLLSGRSGGLQSGAQWSGADFGAMDEGDLGLWRLVAGAEVKRVPGQGLRLQEGHTAPGQDWSFMTFGPLTVDLDRYPILEAEVPQLDGPGARWGIKLTWDRNADGTVGGPEDDLNLPFPDRAGTERWNIAELAGLHGKHTFAYIQLHVAGPGASVLFRRVRFVSTAGQAPPPSAARPLADLGLPIRRDLRGQFKDSVAAYDWALAEVMPRCNPRFAHAVDGRANGVVAGGGPITGFDWPVMNRAVIFNLTCAPTLMPSYGDAPVGGSAPQAAMYRRLLAALTPPAQITGYGEPEGYWCQLLSQHGHYSFHFGGNWSFHNRVPAKGPLHQKQQFTPENVHVQPGKYLVCFMTSEGDTMKGPIPFFMGSWFDRVRGSVPTNWGLNPLMAKQFPAMLSYYYDTATPADYFFAGCSGAGYCYPDELPNLEQFARHTRDACRLADIPCIDLWGAAKEDVRRRYAEITQPLGLTLNSGGAQWNLLPGGVPVVGHELAYWQYQAVNSTDFVTPFADDAKRAAAVKWVVQRIESIAQRHYPPFVILVYSDLHGYAHHCQLNAEIARALDPARFQAARLDEALAALRAWTRGRVLVGTQGINDRLAWAGLQSVPTRVPLRLANGGGRSARAQVELLATGAEPQRAEVALPAGEARQTENLRLLLRGTGEARTGRLKVTANGRSDEYDVNLAAVPFAGQVAEAEFAGAWSSVSLQHQAGQSAADADALWGQAWSSPPPGGKGTCIQYGPYAEMPAGKYVIAFRLQRAAGSPAADQPLGTLDVYCGGYEGTAKTVASRDVRAADFTAPGQWQWFTLEADWPGRPSLMETRVMWSGRAELRLDRVVAFRIH